MRTRGIEMRKFLFQWFEGKNDVFEEEFEFDNDVTDEEIDAEYHEWLFNHIDNRHCMKEIK